MRVPQREVSARELAKAENPPGEVLEEHVAARPTQQDAVTAGQDPAEEGEEDEEEDGGTGQLAQDVRARGAEGTLQRQAGAGERSPVGRPASSRSARATSIRAMRLRQA